MQGIKTTRFALWFFVEDYKHTTSKKAVEAFVPKVWFGVLEEMRVGENLSLFELFSLVVFALSPFPILEQILFLVRDVMFCGENFFLEISGYRVDRIDVGSKG